MLPIGGGSSLNRFQNPQAINQTIHQDGAFANVISGAMGAAFGADPATGRTLPGPVSQLMDRLHADFDRAGLSPLGQMLPQGTPAGGFGDIRAFDALAANPAMDTFVRRTAQGTQAQPDIGLLPGSRMGNPFGAGSPAFQGDVATQPPVQINQFNQVNLAPARDTEAPRQLAQAADMLRIAAGMLACMLAATCQRLFAPVRAH